MTILFACLLSLAPTIDELIELRRPLEVAIAPDGKTVLYVVQETNWKDDRYDRQIWLVREGAAPRALTHASRSSFSPRWSSDGKWIAFLSDRTEKNQIYRMPGDGGEPERLTDLEDVESFLWSPGDRYNRFHRQRSAWCEHRYSSLHAAVLEGDTLGRP